MEIDLREDNLDCFDSLQIEEVDAEEEEEEEEEEEDEKEAEFDDEEEEEQIPVILGFVERPKNPRSLLHQFFPSKAGGVPAWLNPVDLPAEKSRVCGICGEPLQFLLQVYAPISEKESAFHRTLFLFMCTSMSCLLQDQHEQWKRRPEKPSRSVKVFRSQLPCQNTFYSSEPPRLNRADEPLGVGAALCNWCCTWKGEKVCGSCRQARYCSEKHQIMHWCSGHKIDCRRISITSQSSDCSQKTNRNVPSDDEKVASNTLWPEYEIVSEDECVYDEEVSEVTDGTTALVSSGQLDDSLKSLLDKFEGDDDKRNWASFQESIAKAPEQVLRYSRDERAKPLWPMSSGQPSIEDIPKCNYCNSSLCFEFQVLPQLLYYFGVRNDADSLDWATIVVYTCTASCEAGPSYKDEFAWVQLSSASAM